MAKKSADTTLPTKGNKRVVIRNILPSVDNGTYPAKAVTGFPSRFTAAIFCDGAEKIEARLQYRFTDEKDWQQLPLQHESNDTWAVSLVPERTGMLEFRIRAWVSELDGWADGFRKKKAAGLDMTLEEEVGAGIVKALLSNAGKKDKALAKLAPAADKRFDPDEMDEQFFLKLLELAPAEKVSVTAVYRVRIERKKAQFSTWYELFPRSCAPEAGRHGTFRDVTARLPVLAEAGFDVLYLPPIHPIGTKNRKGKNNSLKAEAGDPGSPWAIGNETGGHKALHPELGALSDFQHLVAQAKRHRIELAMDIAFQCAPDHPYVTEHPAWFKWLPDGTVRYAENPPKKYEDILPFDFDSSDWQALWEELLDIFRFWAQQGIRIFRVDNPHTKSLPMWEWLVKNLVEEYPDVILLAEAFTRPHIMEHLAMIGFTQSYTYFTWRETKADLESYMQELTQGEKQFFFRPNFWPNTPDILPPHLVTGGEHAHVIRLLLAATLSSSYGIYGPVFERGVNFPARDKDEYADNEKYEIRHWEPQPESRIWQAIKKINHCRNSYSALQETNNISFLKVSNDKIIAYIKWDSCGNEHLLITINLDPHVTQSGWVNIPYERLIAHYKSPLIVQDLLEEEASYDWNKDWNYVELDPKTRPAHVFRFIISQ